MANIFLLSNDQLFFSISGKLDTEWVWEIFSKNTAKIYFATLWYNRDRKEVLP